MHVACRAVEPHDFSPREHRDMILSERMLELQQKREDADRQWRIEQAREDHEWRKSQSRQERKWRVQELRGSAKQHCKEFWWMGTMIPLVVLVGSIFALLAAAFI